LPTAIKSHKLSQKTLSTLFASKARVAVLQVFMLDPHRAYYQRQLEQATGLAIRGVQRELERLTTAGLLYRRAEGNRTYYQVDRDYPLFPELHGLVLKTAATVPALRGALALDEGVRLAFLSGDGKGVLVVPHAGRRPVFKAPPAIAVEIMQSDVFLDALTSDREKLVVWLSAGCDLLGRREDVIWRHIEAAGWEVKKGEGVP
jgi:DNA-binding transcriptional ArsR family regulator